MKDPQESTEITVPQVERKRTDRYRRQGFFRPVTALLVAVGALIISLIAFLGVQLLSHSNELPPGPATSTAVTPATSKGSGSSLPGQKETSPWSHQEFVSTVLNYTAEKLHLSLDELSARVQAGAQFRDVAIQQGIPAEQVRVLELDALQSGLNKLVSINIITQEQADMTRAHWQQRASGDLDGDFTGALGGVQTVPKDQLTPSV